MFINCHSYFSLRYGTLSVERLVDTASRWGIETLALTDINNTSAAWDFVKRCKEAGIRPVLGIEFRRDNEFLYLGLARDIQGWKALVELLNIYTNKEKELPKIAPSLQNCWVVYPRLNRPITEFRDHEFLGIRPQHVNRLFSHQLRNYQHKLVVLQAVTFLDETGFELHRLLRAIDLNTIITKVTNKDVAHKNEQLIPPETLLGFYKSYPGIIQNTQRILEACSIDWKPGLHHNRKVFGHSESDDYSLLKKLAIAGCKRRYGATNRLALERVNKELRVIREQDFCAYFLITWDVIRYARSVGYYHVGRGSGANSIVAYCLQITDVDPLELDLYFERFINPHRVNPPDFDIDFSWDERDDIIDYIFKRYGSEYTALLATYNTFKGKSVVRELGKVFGLPKREIDAIIDDPVQAAGENAIARNIFKYGKMMEGFPNYLSIHAGGILIAHRPLSEYTALQMMPKGFPIVQFDMYQAEAIGFHKYDILSQRGLGHIKDAIEIVHHNQGVSVDIHHVEMMKTDEAVRQQLKSGKCMGCFYIESPAMRGLLQKLHCDNYIHLVAASSIIRPGVAKSGMMKEYIRRFHQPDGFEYLHPVFEEYLGETFGIMVYQEDVIKVVHHFAGLDLDESDVLRRIMSGKKHKKETLDALRQKYFYNCEKRGYSRTLAQEVWRQIESFSGYSFSKAHSASYAVESFQSLYLKTYFPLEFMVAVINNFGGFYSSEYYFHEARMSGAVIHAPCVNHSNYLTTIFGKDIYVGFVHLNGLEKQLAHRIEYQRTWGGKFLDLADFVNRVKISSEQLDLLLRIGAFRFTGRNKYELMWDKNAVYNPKEKHEASLLLFDETVDFELPELKEGVFDQAFDELELLGFMLRSPFDLLMPSDKRKGNIRGSVLKYNLGRYISILGYFVNRKKVYTSNAKIMAFGTWIDEDGVFFDTTHFPNFLKLYPFRGKGIYRIEGKVVEEFGFYSIEVMKMSRLAMVEDERY